MKKSQITIFVILGILIMSIFFFASVYYISEKGTLNPDLYNQKSVNFDYMYNSIYTYSETCLEQQAKNGINIFGADLPKVTEYIQLNGLACFNDSLIKGVQINVTPPLSLDVKDGDYEYRIVVSSTARITWEDMSKGLGPFSFTVSKSHIINEEELFNPGIDTSYLIGRNEDKPYADGEAIVHYRYAPNNSVEYENILWSLHVTMRRSLYDLSMLDSVEPNIQAIMFKIILDEKITFNENDISFDILKQELLKLEFVESVDRNKLSYASVSSVTTIDDPNFLQIWITSVQNSLRIVISNIQNFLQITIRIIIGGPDQQPSQPISKPEPLQPIVSPEPSQPTSPPESLPVQNGVNDEFYSYQWYLKNNGQFFEGIEADINIEEAWNVSIGANTSIIAIIDTGIFSNPDLSPNILYNKSFNILDNDYNIYPKDDGEYHGTHVAGIIASQIDNSMGIAGICPKCKIINMRIMNSSLKTDSSSVLKAIFLSIKNGAKIISMSFGGSYYSEYEAKIFKDLSDSGIIFVASAGNDGNNQEKYPAAYPGVISVGATDNTDQITSFSNYGSWVDIFAPGYDILSSCGVYDYCFASGTSMSTPMVSAIIGLMKSVNNSLTPLEIENMIKDNSDSVNGIRRINAGKILSHIR